MCLPNGFFFSEVWLCSYRLFRWVLFIVLGNPFKQMEWIFTWGNAVSHFDLLLLLYSFLLCLIGSSPDDLALHRLRRKHCCCASQLFDLPFRWKSCVRPKIRRKKNNLSIWHSGRFDHITVHMFCDPIRNSQFVYYHNTYYSKIRGVI